MAAVAAVKSTPLQSGYCFWYMRRGKGAAAQAAASAAKKEAAAAGGSTSDGEGVEKKETAATPSDPAATTQTQQQNPIHPYENSVKTITTVKTVEQFWEIYNYLIRPNELPTTTDYHFFRDGIKPTWEDPNNAKGGKWIVRLRKGLASRYWEEIILALIGGGFTQFSSGIPDGEICGAVVSIRYSEDIISVWNRTASDRDITERLRDAIKRVLQLPHNAHMEYKPHQTSLQDKSSFRNTQVWKPKSFAEGRSGDRGDRGSTSSHSHGGEHHGPRRSSSWGADRGGDDHHRGGGGGSSSGKSSKGGREMAWR